MFVTFKRPCLMTLAFFACGWFLLSVQTQQALGQTVKDKAATAETSTSQDTKVDEEIKALHDKLSKYLTGTKWTGQFTSEGKDKPATEYYEILSAEKNEVGDLWNLVARIKYGGHDQTFPLPPIAIKFAGKTPVITVDRVRFPGFGVFDARVLIRSGKYSGTWAHSGGAGGHLFGKIEKMDADEVKQKSDKVEKTESDNKKEQPKPEDK